MTIAPSILLRQPPPDCQQLAVIAHGSGPMLVLAGPGSARRPPSACAPPTYSSRVESSPSTCSSARLPARRPSRCVSVSRSPREPPATPETCPGFEPPPFTAFALATVHQWSERRRQATGKNSECPGADKPHGGSLPSSSSDRTRASWNNTAGVTRGTPCARPAGSSTASPTSSSMPRH